MEIDHFMKTYLQPISSNKLEYYLLRLCLSVSQAALRGSACRCGPLATSLVVSCDWRASCGWLPLHYEPSVDLEREKECVCVRERVFVCERESGEKEVIKTES